MTTPNVPLEFTVTDLNVGPYCAVCVKCRSEHRPLVMYREGPHPQRWRDYLKWACIECHFQWFTETADYQPTNGIGL